MDASNMKHSHLKFKVLLVANDPEQARLVKESLSGTLRASFDVKWVSRVEEDIESTEFSIVLLDIETIDESSREDIRRIAESANEALLVVMLANDDKKLIRQVLAQGADEFIDKRHINHYWLPNILNYMLDNHSSRHLLKLSEAKFRAISDASPLGIFVSDEEGSCIYTNLAYQKISGLDLQETLGVNWCKAVHPDDRQRVLSEWQKAATEQTDFKTEFRFLRDDQTVVWTRVNSAQMQQGKSSSGYVQTLEDISERKLREVELKQAKADLFDAKEQAQVTLNSIGDAVMTIDLKGCVQYLNPAAESMTGWGCHDAKGKPLLEVFRIINSKTGKIVLDPSIKAIKEDIIVVLANDSILVRRDGLELPIEDSAAPIHDRNGIVSGAVIVFRDGSKSVNMALKMAQLAHHDYLTKLPNRLLLDDRVSQAIAQARRHKKMAALLLIDLDYFKYINDSLGHFVGDKLLQSIASRLLACVRTADTVSRLGGDEFVILLAEIESVQDASHIADKLLTELSKAHHIDENELHITPSIGISIFPLDGKNTDTLLKNADTAMYHAKEHGRNRYQFFTSNMNTMAVRRMQVEVRLRRAIKNDEFILDYQPKFTLSTGILNGVEALVRWKDPELGLLYPKDFISIAEECGLIIPLGRWVLGEVCLQISVWLEAGLRVVPIAVNISALEFRNKNFLVDVIELLNKTGVAAHYLELELTESVLMHEVEASTQLLKSLKTLGLRLAIDDFGTGYSSLSYLKRFPIDTLKIDQSFVQDMTTDSDDATIVSAVIGMGKNLKQLVVAEGVETKEQLEFLKNELCDVGQGFLFSRPLSAEKMATLFDNSAQSLFVSLPAG